MYHIVDIKVVSQGGHCVLHLHDTILKMKWQAYVANAFHKHKLGKTLIWFFFHGWVLIWWQAKSYNSNLTVQWWIYVLTGLNVLRVFFFFQNYWKYISYKLPRSKIIDCIVDQRDRSLIAHIHLFLLCVLQYYNFGPVSWQNALVYGSNCDCGHNLAQLARFSLIIHYSGGTCSIAVLWGLLTKPYNAVQILCVGTTQVIIRDGKQHGI